MNEEVNPYPQFEYLADPRPVTTDTVELTEWLNKKGASGWELVAIENGIFYFKRGA